jgi:cell division protein FtsN
MPQTIEDKEQEQDKTYHKSIDALIEDAEIEAEIEAEKTIRSKNARLVTISLVGIALIAVIYWQVTGATSSKENDEVALPELTETQPAAESPADETGLAPISDPAPVAELAQVSDPTPAITEEPQPQAAEIPKAEPVDANPAPVPPVEKKVEPAIAKAPPIQPTLPPLAKTSPVVAVPQPVKKLTPKAPAVKKYSIQLGLFSIEGNAKAFAKQIKKKGFQPIIKTKSAEAERHVVFIGGFATKESGSQALSDLKAKGFDSAMEKLADNTYTIVVGKFVTSNQAEALRDQLSLEGFLSSSRQSPVTSSTYTVQVGEFDSLSQAKVMQKKIGRAGFNDSFIR